MPFSLHNIFVWLFSLINQDISRSGSNGNKIIALLIPGKLANTSSSDWYIWSFVSRDSLLTIKPTLIVQFQLEYLNILDRNNHTFFTTCCKMSATTVKINWCNIALDLIALDQCRHHLIYYNQYNNITKDKSR